MTNADRTPLTRRQSSRENRVPPIRPREAETLHARTARRSPSFFWPIALIGIGALMLLANMGSLSTTGLTLLWRLWPIALIALGIDVLIGHRSVAGAIAGGVLILLPVGFAIGVVVFAEQIPYLAELTEPAVVQTTSLAHPLADAEHAEVIIDWTGVPGTITALDSSSNLMEADVAYRDSLIFDVDEGEGVTALTLDTSSTGLMWGAGARYRAGDRWDVRLSPAVLLDLELDAGSSSYTFDLAELEINSFFLDAGSGPIDLTLPANTFDGEIDGSSGPLTLHVPASAGLRVELDDGSGPFNPGDRLTFVSGDPDDKSVWETPGYDRADSRIRLVINQGSGPLQIARAGE